MRISRPYVQLDPAVIEQARQMDLLQTQRGDTFCSCRIFRERNMTKNGSFLISRFLGTCHIDKVRHKDM